MTTPRLLLLAAAFLAAAPAAARAAVLDEGTIYVQTNGTGRTGNAVLAYHYRNGNLRPVHMRRYKTGGRGSEDLLLRGVLDSDGQIAIDPSGQFLYAVNAGTDTIAGFRIDGIGRLTRIPGSPFRSRGPAPAALGIRGNVLIAANKAQDGIRNLTRRHPNYVSFRIQLSGRLTPIGHPKVLPLRSSPTQTYVVPRSNLVFSTEETGFLRGLTVGPRGGLGTSPGSPHRLEPYFRNRVTNGLPVWPQGLVALPGPHLLYSGVANATALGIWRYNSRGRLTFVHGQPVRGAVLPCWTFLDPKSKHLYVGNAGNDTLSVFTLGNPRRPHQIQTFHFRSPGNPWSFAFEPNGRHIFVVNPRDSLGVPRGKGNVLEVLRVSANGKVSEPNAPLKLPVPIGTNPYGLAVVPFATDGDV